MTTSIGGCSCDDGDFSVVHRLQDQSGPGMMVPGRKTAKFDDLGGTKSRQSPEIRA
jgi:hypothetical protein